MGSGAVFRSISSFVQGLRALPTFGVEEVFDFIKRTPIDPASLKPYLYFSTKRYTRNLVYRDDLFEVIALCWGPGQFSAVHDHGDQKCWMSVPIGSLEVQNFKTLLGASEVRAALLEPASKYTMNATTPGVVTEDEKIHAVKNVEPLSVSIHVYSKPIEQCTLFDIEHDRAWAVQLGYFSTFGELVDQVEPAPKKP